MPVKNTNCDEIRLILTSVNSVLTDGGLYYHSDGLEMLRFSSRDEMGVRLWQKVGGQLGVISARSMQLIRDLAADLNVTIVRPGTKDKLAAVERISDSMGIPMKQICFVGGDLPDIRAMSAVGFGATVADAPEEVRAAADLVCRVSGGHGALREVVETILKKQNLWNVAVQEFLGQM